MVEVDREHALAVLREVVNQQCGDGGFADATFLVRENLTEMATRKLDRKLWAEENRLSDIASGSSLSAIALYRFGIAAIEAHCQGEFGLRFHELPVPSQLAVLTQLDEPRPFHLDEDFEPLSAMLVVDAVESYFDVLADEEAGRVAHKLTSAVDPFSGVPWRAE